MPVEKGQHMDGVNKIYRLDRVPWAQIPREAIRDPKITSNGFRLLAYLMSHENGYVLRYEQIERETGLGRFAINGAVSNLTELGWLRVDRPKLENGQFGAKAWFVLNPNDDEVTSVGNSTVGDSTLEQPTDLRRTKNLEKKNVKYSNPQAPLEAVFEEFWNYYPRKVEKLAAKRAFARAYAEYGDAVLEGVKRLANDPNKPEKQYLPHPSTWLNGGRWNDEPYPARQRTPEELAAIAKEQAEKRRAVEAEHSRRLREEMAKALETSSAPPECEHGKPIIRCVPCSKKRADG